VYRGGQKRSTIYTVFVADRRELRSLYSRVLFLIIRKALIISRKTRQ